MKVDRTRALAAFGEYASRYDPDDPKIRLKIDHTYRVADLCDRIARDAGLADGEVDVAWLCGLLHDVGRFEQVRRYGTFNDARSVAHAAMGVQVLFDEGRIFDYIDAASPADEVRALRVAVRTHSDFRLPPCLDARTQTLCDLLRDADKVDILKAICESDMASVLNVTPAQIAQSELSGAVVDAFYAHRTVRRDERSFPADYLMGYACLVFELVHPLALRIACDQGFVFRLFDVVFERADTSAQVDVMAGHLRRWTAQRLGG